MEKKKNTKKKKVKLIITLVIVLIPVIIAGVLALKVYNLGFAHNKERIAEFEALDGVIEVKEIWTAPMYPFKEKYMITFEQPLDWSDFSKGTFPQRVEVSINNNPRITVMETEGYCLNDKVSIIVAISAALNPPQDLQNKALLCFYLKPYRQYQKFFLLFRNYRINLFPFR